MMESTILTSFSGPFSLTALGASTASAQSAGTSILMYAVAPASIAFSFISTISLPFFMNFWAFSFM